MKTITTAKGEFTFVEIPDKKPTKNGEIDEEICIVGHSAIFRGVTIHIPEGGFKGTYLFKTITEEHAIDIVDGYELYPKEYPNYFVYENHNKGSNILYFETAIESLHSLLQSEGLKTTQDYIILKKINEKNK